MGRMPRFFIALLILTFCQTVQAQRAVDSLFGRLQLNLPATERDKTELDLIDELLFADPKRAGLYIDSVETRYLSHKSDAIKIRFMINKAAYNRMMGDRSLAWSISREALDLATINPDSLFWKARVYNIMGSIADDESDVDSSIEYHLIALRYAEQIGNDRLIATIHAGIGRAYLFISDCAKAKVHYEIAISIKERLNERDPQLARYYNNMSNCFDAVGDYETSLEYLDKSILLREDLKNTAAAISGYNNKAYTLLLMKRYQEAEESILRGKFLSDSLEIENEQMYTYSTYAEILFEQGKTAKVEELMETSTEIALRYKDYYLAQYNLEFMHDLYYAKGDYKTALDYYKKQAAVRDSVSNVRSRSQIEKLSLEYETEKKNREIEYLNTENALAELQLKKSNQLQLAFGLAALLSITVLLLLWSRHKNKVKTDRMQKEAMERHFQQQLSEAELQALRAQMNPHFLFNCLNSINSFIIKNEQELASEYLAKFSKLIRRVLNNSKSPRVTLANELEALELYIQLEAVRFSNKFEYRIELHEDLETDYIEIPPLLLQPYVENSIWHGLMHKTDGPGLLTISLKKEQDVLKAIVEDNGIGREAALARKSKTAHKHKSYGMNITSDRLANLNKGSSAKEQVKVLDLVSPEGDALGTRVELTIGI